MSPEDESSYDCPSCGEEIHVPVEPGQGDVQEYVEDCPVCCRPNLLSVRVDASGRVTIAARPE